MPRFRKFLALSTADKLLLLRCVPVVAATKLGLVTLSYRTLKRWIPSRASAYPASIDELRRTGWGVRNAARLVPGATCLTAGAGGPVPSRASGTSYANPHRRREGH